MRSSAATTIYNTARQTVERYELIPRDQVCPLVLMVSGGADSVSLFRLYVDGAFGEMPAVVAHVNHCLRGEASEGDEEFVRELSAAYDIPCEVRRTDVAQRAEREKENIEAVGREERYAFAEEVLSELCQENGVAYSQGRIVTAHTISDRAETFLMRTIKGGGTSSFGSIQRRRGNIIRPLLDVDGETLRACLEAIGQPWREDATNRDTDHLRAYVRHEIIPLLKAQNPRFESTLARSADLIASEAELLDELTEIEANEVTIDIVPEDRILFDARALAELSPALAKRVIRMQILKTFAAAYRIEAFHIEQIVNSLNNSAGFVSDITGALRARIEYGTLSVTNIERRA